MKMPGVIAVLFLALPLSALAQTTRRVPADYATIQLAIDAAVAGDTVEVAPGTYVENVNFNGLAITVRSSQGPAVTVIDGGGNGAVITMESGEAAASVLQGFTITNGNSPFGGGITTRGSTATIVDNIFEYNTQGSGGHGAAIGGNGASPVIMRNLFRQNICDDQNGSGVVAFVNSSEPRIADNVFDSNPCRAINLSLPTGNEPIVVNNTIVRNPVGIKVSAGVEIAAQIYRNNLIYGNGVGFFVDAVVPENFPTWENNLVFGNSVDYMGTPSHTGLNGNLSADPRLDGLDADDYHLGPRSAAIDAGHSLAVRPGDRDFYGGARVRDGDHSRTVDIGAAEFGGLRERLGGRGGSMPPQSLLVLLLGAAVYAFRRRGR